MLIFQNNNFWFLNIFMKIIKFYFVHNICFIHFTQQQHRKNTFKIN